VLSWAAGEFRALPLEAIDVRYGRYRLTVQEAEEAMARSLRRYGQIAPIVVWLRDEAAVLVDGFKRLAAARMLKGMESLSARRIETDERGAKAAMYALNRTGRHFGELEEAWLVQALVREDGLSQAEVAVLLGRHKSWVCRRLAMMEKLCPAAEDDLRMGLLSPTMARQLIRLPAGNQQGALETKQRHGLSAAELRGVVDLLLASGIYNTRFLAFATHYGFRPIACRPKRPQTKGKVERPFWYAETNLLSGREFRSLEHLNEVTAWWLAEVADVRVHRQTKRRPIDLFAEEVPHLIPLPERPYEVAEVVYRTVDAEGMVPYAQNRYSAPWQYIGQVLPVRITEEEVVIYGPRLERLARHARFPPTERHRQSRQPEHLPPRDVERRREVLRERFAQLGSLAVRFLEVDRAVRYGAFSAKSVERILAVQARPKTCWERMAEEEPSHLKDLLSDDPTPPRSATEYQHLLFEESDSHDETAEEEGGPGQERDAPPSDESS